jgi:hypothetical protein
MRLVIRDAFYLLLLLLLKHILKLYLYINFSENYLLKFKMSTVLQNVVPVSCIFRHTCNVVIARIHTFMVRSYVDITCWIFLIIFFKMGCIQVLEGPDMFV